LIFLFAIPLYSAVRLMSYPNPIYFLIVFVFGYVLFSDARFGEAVDKHKLVALILGPLLYLAIPYFQLNGWPANLPGWARTILIAYVDGFAAWFFLVAILGYGKVFLNFTNRSLKYLGEASYPIYILHQTVIVIIGYFVVQWSVGVPVKYGTILIAASLVTFLLYDLVVKRTRLTRLLFGMRPKKKKEEAQEQPFGTA
jgi:glucan biosynthesis protein C